MEQELPGFLEVFRRSKQASPQGSLICYIPSSEVRGFVLFHGVPEKEFKGVTLASALPPGPEPRVVAEAPAEKPGELRWGSGAHLTP